MTDQEKLVAEISKPIIAAAHAAVAGLLENREATTAKIQETATQALEGAGNVLGDALKKGAKLVQEHPVESMIAGFGVGCLVGALMLRRD